MKDLKALLRVELIQVQAKLGALKQAEADVSAHTSRVIELASKRHMTSLAEILKDPEVRDLAAKLPKPRRTGPS